jgi:hypothetical protein
MKTLFISAALAIVGFSGGAATAFADPPGRFGPQSIAVPAATGQCDLRIEGGALVALAAPWNARNWSLTVRAPGLEADQGGGFYGEGRQLERLSQIYLIETVPTRGRQHARIDSEDVLKRPLRAALTVTGHDGRTVCTDNLYLAPERGPIFPRRPF